MLADLVKTKKITLQKAISYFITEGITSELSNLVQLKGEKLKNFKEALGVKVLDPEIYYNNFNVLFVDEETYEEFKSYMPKDSLRFRLELPELNVNFWAHSLVDNHIFNNFLTTEE